MRPRDAEDVIIPAWRVVAAFVIAPGMAALLVAAVVSLPNLTWIWATASAYALVGAYPAAIVFGVPAFFFLRKRLAPTCVNCAATGAAVSILPWLALALIRSTYKSQLKLPTPNLTTSEIAWNWLNDIGFMGLIALCGAVGGALFWIIAAYKSRPANIRFRASK